MLRKLLLLLLLVVPLYADEPAFFIERIEVRNQERVSPEVVIAESRLRAGQQYSEAELRDAAVRLARLPFLLSVDFSLEKGSARGRYILVLAVNETKPFFLLLDVVPFFESDDTYSDIHFEDRIGDHENLALGFRWFVGRRGAVHVGFSLTGTGPEFTSEYPSFVAGYTQYDLFGTRAFATLNLKRPIEWNDEGLLSPQLVVGIPLSANQTVTAEYDETRFKGRTRTLDGIEFKDRYGQKVVSARWSYNTTNEPFYPTEGTLLTVKPHFAWQDGQSTYYDFPGGRVVTPTHARTYGLEAGATRYRELTERSSVWGDIHGRWEHINRRESIDPLSTDESAASGSVGLGYAYSLWTRQERTGGDSRFEYTARYTNRPRDGSRIYSYEPDVLQLGWSWIRRSSWGTVRLGVGYAW
jgi:outer membrane protein assembly factor BamA